MDRGFSKCEQEFLSYYLAGFLSLFLLVQLLHVYLHSLAHLWLQGDSITEKCGEKDVTF